MNRVIVFNFGDFWLPNARESVEAACQRWGADLRVFTGQPTDAAGPIEAKYWLPSMAGSDCKRVLYLDADMVIREDCPNIFDQVPAESFAGAVNFQGDTHGGDFHRWHNESWRWACDRLKVEPPLTPQTYINGGLLLFTPGLHDGLFAKLRQHCRFPTGDEDQAAFSVLMATEKLLPAYLPREFNRIGPAVWSSGGRMDAYVHHFAAYMHWRAGDKAKAIEECQWRAGDKRQIGECASVVDPCRHRQSSGQNQEGRRRNRHAGGQAIHHYFRHDGKATVRHLAAVLTCHRQGEFSHGRAGRAMRQAEGIERQASPSPGAPVFMPGPLTYLDEAPIGELVSLAAGSAAGVKVDKEKGIIANVAVMTVGPARGHGFQIDSDTIASALKAFNANANVKSRFTHPERRFDGDSIEFTVGRPQNFRIDGDTLRADIHLLKSAANLPGMGNVRGWLLDMAEEDPRIFGMSVVVRFSFVKQVDPKTGLEKEPVGIVEYAHAVDFVGNPAANPNGLLSTPKEGKENMKLTAAQLALLATLGLAANSPDDKVKEFIAALSTENKAKLDALAEKPAPAPTPAPTPAAAPDPASLSTPAPAIDPAAVALAERQRISHILTAHERDFPGMLSAEFRQQHVNAGTTPEQFRVAALEEIAKHCRPIEGLRITAGDDQRDSLGQAVTDAMFLSHGGTFGAGEQPHARAREFMGRKPIQVARQFLQALGIPVINMGDFDVAKTVMSRRRMASATGNMSHLAMSTSDFPQLLANSLRKRLQRSYAEQPSTWEFWCSRDTTDDFKQVSVAALGHIPTPPAVLEGADYTFASVGEKNEVVTLVKYGIMLRLTWESLINDDLRAFNRRALGFAAAAKRLENDLAYAQLTGNQTMTEDTTALFHANHNNLNYVPAAAISETTIDGMRVGMALQKGIAPASVGPYTTGPVLNLTPRVLLVPQKIASTAQRLVASTVKPGGSNAEPSLKFLNELQVVSDSRLDADSTTAHYLIADKSQIDTAVVMFLAGYEAPTIEEEDAMGNDCRDFQLRHVCAARVIDWRGFQKNAGA